VKPWELIILEIPKSQMHGVPVLSTRTLCCGSNEHQKRGAIIYVQLSDRREQYHVDADILGQMQLQESRVVISCSTKPTSMPYHHFSVYSWTVPEILLEVSKFVKRRYQCRPRRNGFIPDSKERKYISMFESVPYLCFTFKALNHAWIRIER
jgi:hypothetical protein